MLENAGWYVEHAGLTNAELHSRRVEAMECALPHLEAVIGEWGMEKWFGNVPIASEIAEEEFLRGLPTFEGGGMEGILSRMWYGRRMKDWVYWIAINEGSYIYVKNERV
jgi:hypothetical protein